MAKMRITVESLAIKLNSRLCHNFSLNSKKQKRKGFSVAEAMIALLIGSLALGMAAPMITKQIKSSGASVVMDRLVSSLRRDVQNNSDRITALETTVGELTELVTDLEQRVENALCSPDYANGITVGSSGTASQNGWISDWGWNGDRWDAQFKINNVIVMRRGCYKYGDHVKIMVPIKAGDRWSTNYNAEFVFYPCR